MEVKRFQCAMLGAFTVTVPMLHAIFESYFVVNPEADFLVTGPHDGLAEI